MYLDKVYHGYGGKIEYEDNKVLIPYDEYSYWTTDYSLNGDTLRINDTIKWVRFKYSVQRFLEDISNDYPKVYVLPDIIDKSEGYLDFVDHLVYTSALVHIGLLKDCNHDNLNIDSLYNYKGYFIQLNDVFGNINDMLNFCGSSKKVILNADKSVPSNFMDTLGNEIRKYARNCSVYRTYVDTLNYRLKIKKLNYMQHKNKAH